MVLAVGSTQIDAALATAPNFPAVRFITVDGGTPGSNVAVIAADPPDALAAALDRELDALADAAS